MSSGLSFWGWGEASRLPVREAREALSGQIAALLGQPAPEVREPPRPEALELPAPRVAPPASLAGICTRDPLVRAGHTYGKGYRDIVRGLSGDFSPAPDVVARPTTESEIAALLDWASRERVAAVPFGGGTSVVGGVECRGEGYRGVLCLDLKGLDRVLEIDDVSRAARIQAGATGPVLEAQLTPSGLSLRHYPQSFQFSTLGGWIATRAGGHFATGYTHIDDLVASTRTLTPAGVMETRRLPGDGAGPAPDRLVIGSEGIFGVITEAWVRLQARPRWRSRASVGFARFEDGVAAARTIAQAGLFPANCRLLDAREATLHQVPSGAGGVLLLGFESAHHPVERWLEIALEAARGCGGAPLGEPRHSDAGGGDRGGARDAASGRWRQAFFDAPYLQTALISAGVLVDTFETACTWDRFPGLHERVVRGVKGALKEACGGGFVSCRFTHVYPDGPAPYYTFIGIARPGAELAQWAAVKAAASEAILAGGGTITHHHAVGRTHRPWYDRQRPAPFAEALRAARARLDPSGVMNPGVLIDP